MRFSVRHETTYRYSVPVRLGPHVLRFTPQVDATAIRSASLAVTPMPAERRETTDRFGNRVTAVSFAEPTDVLALVSTFELDLRTPPPDAPGGDPNGPPLPWPTGQDADLAAYLSDGGVDATVRAFAEAVAAESGFSVQPFLDRLNTTLFTRLDRKIRPEGAAHSPAHTLATGRGACRDLTVLFMAACRSLGIPARFVSGYQAKAETPDGRRYLHAWPEAFVPGLGWRGFDPTHGTVVTDGHVALCAAPDQAGTMPIEGSFWGSGVTSTLEFRVEIEAG